MRCVAVPCGAARCLALSCEHYTNVRGTMQYVAACCGTLRRKRRNVPQRTATQRTASGVSEPLVRSQRMDTGQVRNKRRGKIKDATEYHRFSWKSGH